MLLPRIAGFFFAFRICLTFLWFQSNPQTGTTVSTTCDILLMLTALFCRMGDSSFRATAFLHIRPLRWIFGFLALSCCSLLWTQAKSPAVTAGYWAGMAAEVFTPMLVLGFAETESNLASMMKGFIIGSCIVALVAWLSPVQYDLRIGNEDFLHPNGLGFEFAIASMCAQYLLRHGNLWKWLSIALAISLLRTISKTSIIAYMIAETFYLLHDAEIKRRTKLYIGAGVVLVLACFSALFESYFNIYSNAGDQAETLTGRTWIWAVSLSMALEKPLLGYGIYAFRAVIPAFGPFEPWHAHNEFLQQFFEYGIVGLFVLAALYWSFFRTARRAPAGKLKTLALALLVFALLHGLTDTISFGLSYPLWLLTGISIALAASMPQGPEAAR